MTFTLHELAKSQRDTPVAYSLAACNHLFLTPNMTLWVVDPIVPDVSSRIATASRRVGAIVGQLHIASKGFPRAFGDDRVVSRTQDADGVVTFTVRRIGPARATPK